MQKLARKGILFSVLAVAYPAGRLPARQPDEGPPRSGTRAKAIALPMLVPAHLLMWTNTNDPPPPPGIEFNPAFFNRCKIVT